MFPTQPPSQPPKPVRASPPRLIPGAQLPPPVSAPVSFTTEAKIRPWWGLGDVFLGVVFILVLAIIGTVVAGVIAVATGEISFDAENLDSLQDDLATSAIIIVVAGGAQQLGQFIWPFIVGRWKGFGAILDFGFRFKLIDLPLGIATGIGALITGGLVGNSLAWLMDVNPEDADNTAFLSDNTDSPWIWGLIAVTVIGAPFSEEILFRGLLLRALEKRATWVAGLVGSSIIFMLVHYQPMAASELAVLFAAIGTAGAIFGAMAIKTGRLGTPIIGHMVFNGVAVLSILLT
jgi:membrane protease YdiL (CAAX protease family)